MYIHERKVDASKSFFAQLIVDGSVYAMNGSFDISFGEMGKQFSSIDCNSTGHWFDPFPYALSCEHLQTGDVLLEQQGQTALIGMTSDSVTFHRVVIFARTRRMHHPAQPVF